MIGKMIEARIIADSVNPYGKRIISALWTYPRFIHAEIMTHRQFSRNSASSRAIPVPRIIKAIKDQPAMPVKWGKNQSGMQARAELEEPHVTACKEMWLKGRDHAINTAEWMRQHGLHKQVANRVMEPWFHITVLVTSTEWHNFFALRAHPDAQPEFQVLAYRMLGEYLKSEPNQLEWGGWHLPFVESGFACDYEVEDDPNLLKVSVARCARTSYTTMEDNHSVEKDVALFDRLGESGHWSPFEHQAQALPSVGDSGNFKDGWFQYRHDFKDQCRRDLDLAEIYNNRPDWVDQAD